MSDTAIRVENLGKLYRIGSNGQRHDTLRDALSAGLLRLRGPSSIVHRPGSRDHRPQTTDDASSIVRCPGSRDHRPQTTDDASSIVHRPGSRDHRPQTTDDASSIVHRPSSDFWALRDVSFEVKRGEVVGVIGRNGAGKSTLLKILSRITEPTTGRVELHGRVGSLLEVGTGFHPELTGRENIYLNGAILSMKRVEIARRFDEIVAFAEIDRFLDTPVKRYSSGMYVRLAFAVAAHLEPEILLVDEVLAVGDAAFQKKCLGKMGDVASEGRTVLFVSHNMAAVRELTYRTVLLSGGELEFDGATDDALSTYGRHDRVLGSVAEYREKGGEGARVVDVTVNGDSPPADLQIGESIHLGIRFETRHRLENACITLIVRDRLGYNVLTLCSLDSARPINLEEGDNLVDAVMTPGILAPGWYTVDIALNPSFTTQALDVVRSLPLCNVHVGTDHRYGSLDQPNRTWGAVHLDSVLWAVRDNDHLEG